jgi:hypothetical protein
VIWNPQTWWYNGAITLQHLQQMNWCQLHISLKSQKTIPHFVTNSCFANYGRASVTLKQEVQNHKPKAKIGQFTGKWSLAFSVGDNLPANCKLDIRSFWSRGQKAHPYTIGPATQPFSIQCTNHLNHILQTCSPPFLPFWKPTWQVAHCKNAGHKFLLKSMHQNCHKPTNTFLHNFFLQCSSF